MRATQDKTARAPSQHRQCRRPTVPCVSVRACRSGVPYQSRPSGHTRLTLTMTHLQVAIAHSQSFRAPANSSGSSRDRSRSPEPTPNVENMPNNSSFRIRSGPRPRNDGDEDLSTIRYGFPHAPYRLSTSPAPGPGWSNQTDRLVQIAGRNHARVQSPQNRLNPT